MSFDFLLYGSTGFVGSVIADLAVETGLKPLLAGRNAANVAAQAARLGLERRVFQLSDAAALDAALQSVPVVLHCAGPYIYTYKPMLDGCLRTGTHYLDITGEISVYEALAAHAPGARERGVMLLPGVGFDVAATDCLALHLKNRLPSATRLTLAFHIDGPAGIPPGTFKTMIELVPYGRRIRRNGRIEEVAETSMRMIDFGQGPVKAMRLTWGDIFMAYHSTGIANIEDYAVFPEAMMKQINILNKLRPLFNLGVVRAFFKLGTPAGPAAEARARTRSHVWGEVEDDQGRKAAARFHGPEAGATWTAQLALAAVHKVLGGDFKPGFMTPALAYGADFVLEGEGVTRVDLD